MEELTNLSPSQEILTEKLKNAIEEIKRLSSDLEKQHISTSVLNQAIKKLEDQTSKARNNANDLKSNGSYQKGVKELFIFYAKQQRLVKHGSAFEDYYQDNTHLSVGEFLKFCRDFGVYSKERLNKKELIEIFKVNCSWKKEMDENEFRRALQHLANKLYNAGNSESLYKLYEFIHADNQDYIKKTAKGFSPAFSAEKLDFRAPLMKIKLPSDKNLPRVTQIQVKRYQSSKNFSHKKPGAILPCDAIVADIKKNSYSSNLAKKLNPMSFTWQTLSSLPSDNFQYNALLKDLIVSGDSDDEILSKHYGIISETPEIGKRKS